MTIALILSDLWREGGPFEASSPQAQELQKSPGGIGLIEAVYVSTHKLMNVTTNAILN